MKQQQRHISTTTITGVFGCLVLDAVSCLYLCLDSQFISLFGRAICFLIPGSWLVAMPVAHTQLMERQQHKVAGPERRDTCEAASALSYQMAALSRYAEAFVIGRT